MSTNEELTVTRGSYTAFRQIIVQLDPQVFAIPVRVRELGHNALDLLLCATRPNKRYQEQCLRNFKNLRVDVCGPRLVLSAKRHGLDALAHLVERQQARPVREVD